MKSNIRTILTRIIVSADKKAFIIRKKYYNEYELKLGQEIEVWMGYDYKLNFLAKIVQVGTNAGIYIPYLFVRRNQIKASKKEIKIKLDLTDPKEINIHKKRAARNNPAENNQQIVKNEGDPNGT